MSELKAPFPRLSQGGVAILMDGAVVLNKYQNQDR